jgi:hypothetical protein
VSLHRRPLGHGRTLAAISGAIIVLGCVLPWWQVGGTPGIPMQAGNAFAGSGIVVFLVGVAVLALLTLPYAAGDRPVGLDRPLSFALLALAGWIGFAWRIVDLALIGAFQFSQPAQVFTNGPGLWVTGLGLAVLARAAYLMTSEPVYR